MPSKSFESMPGGGEQVRNIFIAHLEFLRFSDRLLDRYTQKQKSNIFSPTSSLTFSLECSTLDSKCHQATPKSEIFHPLTSETVIQFFYNAHRQSCQPFILIQSLAKVKDPKWSNQFNTYEECQNLCMHHPGDESKASIDKNMPGPKAPKPWQCTDVPALKNLTAQKNRSCLAYDNSKGYTYVDGECIPSDYSGCIDTYNKFKDIDLCTKSTCLEQKLH